jgi:anti-sigma factor RsiW
MKNAMDHERCSELLLPYVKGELEAADREQVDRHLRSCDTCRKEKVALEELLAVEMSPMTAGERKSLHATVADRLSSASPDREVISAPGRGAGWSTRAAPVLGAVALIALAVVFAAGLLSGGDVKEAGIQGSPGRLQDEADGTEGGAGGGAPKAAPDEELVEQGAPAPHFERDAKDITRSALSKLPENEPAFDVVAGVTRNKAGTLGESYTSALSDQAPADARAQVRECSESVAASQGTVVPTYGAEGEYRGEDALLVGFVSGSDGGPLNRYMLWLWPKGSCDVPLEYLSGPLKK